MSWMNLDLEAAKTASDIAEKARNSNVKKNDAEKLNQNAASVLSHQGISAFFLYLQSLSHKNDLAKEISKQSEALLKTADYNRATFGSDLHQLIEGKQLLDQMLIYLRYHIKTLPDPKPLPPPPEKKK